MLLSLSVCNCVLFSFPSSTLFFFLEKDLLVPSSSIIITLVIFTKQHDPDSWALFFIYVFTILLMMNYNHLT